MASSSNMPAPTQNQPTKPTRRRTPKTCGECRRLKLKCDRVFPCQSCVKRGCEGICPEGSLVSGRGSRYILANTEQLHEKIVHMAERIRDLEDALKAVSTEHARCLHVDLPLSAPVHPLLRDELLLIKNQVELYGADRSQLASKSDVSYTSDGSDGETSRMSSEQPFSPSQLEALLLGSAGDLPDSQLGTYSGNDTLSSPTQLTAHMPYTATQWPAVFERSESYQAQSPMSNSSRASPGSYASAMNDAHASNYPLRNYRTPGPGHLYQNGIGTHATLCSDETQYMTSGVLPQSEAALVNQMCRIWNMSGSSGV